MNTGDEKVQMDTRSCETIASDAARDETVDVGPPARTVNARRIADDRLERERVAADDRLWKFRERVDSLLAHERSVSSGEGCFAERTEADQHTRDERRNMDVVVERERDRADAHVDTQRRVQDFDEAEAAARGLDTNAELIMERRRADRTLIALEKAQSSLATAQDGRGHERDVFAIVTHDLRGPLSVMAANAHFIAKKSHDSTIREAAEDMVSVATRMGRLLMDLMDAARIDSGKLRIVKASHDACALAAEIRQSYQPLFASQKLTFGADIPRGSAFAPLDYDRVIQVLSNLLGNALKFTPEGGTVRLRVQAQASALEFVVRDPGPGIAASALPHIFEKFWQPGTNGARGLGLGLHICKSIIEEHGGKIWVESTVGQGAAFFFTLPLAA
jgi:signal transduction histidine kinase